MRTDSFDYDLPDELIAQSPVTPRDSCRLLVAQRQKGVIKHIQFKEILDYLDPGDLLVVNNTKVMPARLFGHKEETGCKAEVLLLRRLEELDQEDSALEQHWEALVKPGRRLKPGSTILLEGFSAKVLDWGGEKSKGRRVVKLLSGGSKTLEKALRETGSLPLPPYIKDYTGDSSLYQTVYAEKQNSAAAPTAGLHFSSELLSKVEAKGIHLANICLEIGLDTFRRVEEDYIDNHVIHSEYYSLSNNVVEAVQLAKQRGARVIAVGTTVVRALESSVSCDGTLLAADRKQTSLYITPGYHFKVIDALVTNFHTPRSTLLMLVAAFGGYETMMSVYRQALEERYRFLSFGDAMLII
ncbi:MAG: tRNA preQ1(34) S-adenosylmethionine ribosyltransferase-isomerase QueA [Coriobacteriia bacterium]|nr:tRNA preQ1(34) S-adenosylmethionine ribosyltransferase-isomerase QueA [Coriobacteriia bacterium]